MKFVLKTTSFLFLIALIVYSLTSCQPKPVSHKIKAILSPTDTIYFGELTHIYTTQEVNDLAVSEGFTVESRLDLSYKPEPRPLITVKSEATSLQIGTITFRSRADTVLLTFPLKHLNSSDYDETTYVISL